MKEENRTRRQHFFVAKELQASIAILVIIALLGGTFLLYLSKELNSFLGLRTPFLTLVLMVGYAAIIIFLSVFFTHRLIGPFKRLEFEMKLIAKGDLKRRLSIRGSDDWHIRSFVNNVNKLIDSFEETSIEYNKLNSTLAKRLKSLIDEIEEGMSQKDIIAAIEKLRKEVQTLRERW